MNEGIGMRGQFYFKLKAHDGTVKDERHAYNVVTLTGKNAVSALILKDVGGTAFDSIAIGLGSATATNTQTALDTEYAKVACVGTQVQVTSTNDTAQLVASFSFTGAAAIVEAGVFDVTTSAAGIMLARQTFAALNATSGDTLAVTYKITFA